MSNSGAKSPPRTGVEVAKSRTAVPAIHAAHSAWPSYLQILKTKNSTHGMKATAIAASATGQSDIGR